MKFDLLKQLLNEAPFGTHADHLAMGDDSQYGEPGRFDSQIMGLSASIEFNHNSEVTHVDLGDELQYDRDLMHDLMQFAYNGGLGFTQPDVNITEGMRDISYQRARKHNAIVLIEDFEKTRRDLVEVTETTAQLWDVFTQESSFLMGVPLVGNDFESSILFLVPIEEQNNTYVCDLYFHTVYDEASSFLDMVLYNDVNGVVNNSLRVNRSQLAGKVRVRNMFSAEVQF